VSWKASFSSLSEVKRAFLSASRLRSFLIFSRISEGNHLLNSSLAEEPSVMRFLMNSAPSMLNFAVASGRRNPLATDQRKSWEAENFSMIFAV
jgi:hypothetical protein